MLVRSVLVLGALFLALASACTPRNATSGSEMPELLPSLQATTFGDSVQFVLQVTNTTSEPVELEFRSGQMYDFVVERDGSEIWRWSADRMFTQAISHRSLPPSETLTFSASWRPGPGVQGEFTVRGILTAVDVPVEQEARFRIP